MAANKGLWVNYATGEIWEVGEHQTFLFSGDNRIKMGVPDWLWNKIGGKDDPDKRLAVLLQIIAGAPLVRVRQHGTLCSFEFSDPDSSQPLEAIAKAAEFLGLGNFSDLLIINFFTREEIYVKYKDFKEKFKDVEKISQLAENFRLASPLPRLGELIGEASYKRIDESEFVLDRKDRYSIGVQLLESMNRESC